MTMSSDSGSVLSLYSNLGGGAFNAIVQAGDAMITYNTGAQNTGALVLGPWAASGAEGIRIDGNGNIGMGTTNPLAPLHTVGNVAHMSGNVGIGTASPSDLLNMIVSTTNVTQGMTIYDSTNGGSSVGQMQIKNYVGDTFQVAQTSGPYFGTGLWQASAGIVTNSGTGGISVGATSASGMIRMYTGGSAATNERVRIDSSGNVGIGTTTPGAMLAVGNTSQFQVSSSGAVTSQSLLATGIVDGTTPITLSTTTTVNLGGTYKSGYTFNNYATASTAITYNLPTAAAGLQYCVRNYTGKTGTLQVNTSAAGQYIDVNGVLTASGGYVISAGALGDSACFIGVDGTHWAMFTNMGTWTVH